MHELEEAIKRIESIFDPYTAIVNIEVRGFINKKPVVLRPGSTSFDAHRQIPFEAGFAIGDTPGWLNHLAPDGDIWTKYNPESLEVLGMVRVVAAEGEEQ